MSLPATIRCVEIKAPGGAEQLVPATRPMPQLKPDEVMIAVKAAGVNRPDVIQRLGQYPAPPGATDIPGLEVAGVVVARGDAVSWPALGEKVCALVTGGGYADHVNAPAATCLPVPDGFSFIEAAALPETFFTVWHNVFERGALKPGEGFLVHGGTSGIGTTAIQLAKAFGAFVVATAGSDEKCEACRKLGADVAINYKIQDYVEVIRALPRKGVDVILDMVGGDYVPRNLRCLRPDGRHVTIAFLNGPKSEVDFTQVMPKRLTLTGSTLRARETPFKAGLAVALKDKVWPLLNSRKVVPVIDQTYPLDHAADAHRRMESSAHVGKIMLEVIDKN